MVGGRVEACRRHPGLVESGERAGRDSVVGLHLRLGSLPASAPCQAGKGDSGHAGCELRYITDDLAVAQEVCED